MLGSLDTPRLLLLLALALFVLGPERLPAAARDAARLARRARAFLTETVDDLTGELTTEHAELARTAVRDPRAAVAQSLSALADPAPAQRPAVGILEPGASPPWDPDTT